MMNLRLKTRKFIYSVLSILILSTCSKKIYTYNEIIERDANFQKEYYSSILKEYGTNYFFIPKDEIINFLKIGPKDSVSFKELIKNDLVCFLDNEGNIIYQALIDKVVNDTVWIECHDLSQNTYYKTLLHKDSIADLKNRDVKFIKFYRRAD